MVKVRTVAAGKGWIAGGGLVQASSVAAATKMGVLARKKNRFARYTIRCKSRWDRVRSTVFCSDPMDHVLAGGLRLGQRHRRIESRETKLSGDGDSES